MRIDILTLFPDTMRAMLGESILGRAQARGLPIVRADSEKVVLGDVETWRTYCGWELRGVWRAFRSPTQALRAALRETPRA